MTKPYFRQIPDFSYVNRNYDRNKFDDFLNVKNLFKRVKIRDDIFQSLAFFGKYSIVGDERPDNVAYNVYGDASYDWIILLSNNILNIQNELSSNNAFNKVMLEKYESYENLYAIHHYETTEVRDSANKLIMPAGIIVPEKIIDTRVYIRDENGDNVENPNYLNEVSYYVEYYDSGRGEDALASGITIPVTNYEIEEQKNNDKRNIYVLKQDYLGVVLDDIEKLMKYKKGAPQYLSDTLKKGDNIRLFS